MIKTILFDLDGTLLPMDQEKFTKAYMNSIAAKLAPHGFDPKEIIAGIFHGVEAMVRNDGTRTNEQVFWNCFGDKMGDIVLTKRNVFDDFYENDFPLLSDSCGFTSKSKELISKLKADGYRLILATNPIFPVSATFSRIGWAGLSPDDFEFITSYENCHYAKPNPEFFAEILNKINCTPDECLMVGNDVKEDMTAKSIGMNVFLLTDCLINKDNKDISVYPCGSFDELYNYIKTEQS